VTRIVDPKPDNTAYMTGLFAGCPGAALCHNDFHEGNVLIDEGGELTSVIDMENAAAADPLTDIAKTDCYSIRGDRAKWDGLVAGYGPAVLARAEVLPLYRLSHALQLSNWFALVGRTDALAGLADDMRQILT
jgi:hygromycin-B 7''-O-kinase